MENLKTPSLILDVSRVRANAERMSMLATANDVVLRPHIKTHKCVEVARIQTEGRPRAITVSTLAEARAFAAAGFGDITYAVPVEPGKFGEVFSLIDMGVDLKLVTADLATITLLEAEARARRHTPEVFLKIDCGYHRCGVEPADEAALAIARFLADAKNLRFAGILTHAGHSYDCGSESEIRALAAYERDLMAEFAESLRALGIDVPTVSIGSTPTMTHVDHLARIDEIRPGNYIFFDAFQATIGSCTFADCALTVLAAVTHTSRTHRKIVVDAGAIAMSKDRGAVGVDPACGYGRVLDVEGRDLGLRLTALSQEHGQAVVRDDSLFDKLKVGTRLRVLANHSCLTAAQHTHYNVIENGSVVDRWPIHSGW